MPCRRATRLVVMKRSKDEQTISGIARIMRGARAPSSAAQTLHLWRRRTAFLSAQAEALCAYPLCRGTMAQINGGKLCKLGWPGCAAIAQTKRLSALLSCDHKWAHRAT